MFSSGYSNLSDSSISAQTKAALSELREKYPQTPFMTLGQTVLWDEPVKATFCRLFEELEASGAITSGARIVAGVHDTDYFAKLDGVTIRDDPFVVLRHNDGDTRGLWSAAGELSALFGAEVVPSHSELSANGVSLHKAARAYSGGQEALLNQETEAPLWRALVHTEPHTLIAADVKLAEILPALRQQLRWGFRASLETTGCRPDFENDEPCPSRDVARKILGWVEDFAVHHASATLSDLYRDLIPKIWALVRGGATCCLETTTSMELFRFNAQTAGRPRFKFLDIFLNPATRELAKRCYDDAVRGSGIYTLDQFGEGALPFDVVIPGQGRGTLRLFDGKIIVETEEAQEICENCDPETTGRLAAILQTHFGENIALVGKAVSLISMLAAEFIFVFHEKASGYTTRTQKMNEALRAKGIPLDLHPMLRLKYSTWDALAGVDAEFNLPDHLKGAFGRANISAHEFARDWRQVAEEQDQLRAKISRARKPRDLMRLLAEVNGELWREKDQAYVAARDALSMMRQQANVVGARREIAQQLAKQATATACAAERQKGDFFRAHLLPLLRVMGDIRERATLQVQPVDENGKPRRLTKEERAQVAAQEQDDMAQLENLRDAYCELEPQWKAFDSVIESARLEARTQRGQAKELLRQQLEIQRGENSQAARAALLKLENEAELERFRLVRDALIATQSLHQTNYRPTAWWLPMVSPDGKWFDALSKTAQARIEVL